MTIDQGGEDARLTAVFPGWLFVKIGDLQVGISTKEEFRVLMLFLVEFRIPLHRNNKLELPTCHTLELAFELVRVPAEKLNDLGVLHAVEELDRLRVVHETGDRAIQCLSTERSPDSGSQGVLGSSGFESNGVERDVISPLRLGLFIRGERIPAAVEHVGLLRQNLGIAHEVIPLDRMKLLKVFQKRDPRVLILLPDDLSQGQQDLLRVVRDENREGRHSLDGNGFRDGSCEGLSKE